MRLDSRCHQLAGMTLLKFLKAPNWTEEKLARACRQLGCHLTTQSTINRLKHRKRMASLELALTIEQATGGWVMAEKLPLSKRTRRGLRRVRLLAKAA